MVSLIHCIRCKQIKSVKEIVQINNLNLAKYESGYIYNHQYGPKPNKNECDSKVKPLTSYNNL